MKRVLVFGITNNPGGVESVIMNYYRHIDRSKVQFDFLCNTEEVAYEEEIKKLGGNIYRITARRESRKKFYRDLKCFFENNANKYSTIWVNVCSLANIDYLKYAKKYGIKYRIIHSHNSQNMDSKMRMLLHRLNKIIIEKYATDFWTCSDDAGKWFYNKNIINSNKYLFVNNAIDIYKYRFNQKVRDEYKKEMKLNNKFVIGHIGRFHFQKNQLFLLDVFYKIHQKDNDSVLLLIGQGNDENKIKDKIQKLNLEDCVLILGVRDDVNNIMQAMDVFLFPSLFEGLSLVLVEAQAAGLPIVVSNTCVTDKIKIIPPITSLSLNDSLDLWCDNVLNFKDKKRVDYINLLKNSDFNIETEAKKIQKYFERD